MSSFPPSPQAIQITIPPTLRQHTIPLSTFLTRNPQYTNLAIGALIFYPSTPTHPTRLLILQRASTEHAFPNLWEVPGGSSDPEDPTILHSAARETFEETGLRLGRFVREVGKGVEFVTGKNTWVKLSFEIEVIEVHGRKAEGAVDDVEIRLDPEEHQNYKWVTEQEIREDRYPIVTGEQKEVMLEGFELRKAGDAGIGGSRHGQHDVGSGDAP